MGEISLPQPWVGFGAVWSGEGVSAHRTLDDFRISGVVFSSMSASPQHSAFAQSQ